jgi:hypothetical protein
MASKYISELLYLGLHMHLQTHLITASKGIFKLAQTQPPSASLSSLDPSLQVHLLVPLDFSLQVLLPTH